jgi:hypothetical protein
LPLAIFYIPLIPLYRVILVLVWLRVLWRHYRLARRSNFPPADCLISIAGLPVFLWLLGNSWFRRNVLREVSWKGRKYKFR